jgi:hypothetical protein
MKVVRGYRLGGEDLPVRWYVVTTLVVRGYHLGGTWLPPLAGSFVVQLVRIPRFIQ